MKPCLRKSRICLVNALRLALAPIYSTIRIGSSKSLRVIAFANCLMTCSNCVRVISPCVSVGMFSLMYVCISLAISLTFSEFSLLVALVSLMSLSISSFNFWILSALSNLRSAKNDDVIAAALSLRHCSLASYSARSSGVISPSICSTCFCL